MGSRVPCAFCNALPVATHTAHTHRLLSRRDSRDGRTLARRRTRPPPTALAQQNRVDLSAVRRAVRLSDAFRELVRGDMRERGDGEWMACCPFHDDDKPSLSISDTRALFHCFGCGASGDLVEMERRARNLPSLPSALNSLAARYPAVRRIVGERSAPIEGASLVQPPPEPTVRKPIAWGKHVRERRDVSAVLRAAVLIFRDTLNTEAGASALEYLSRRGVHESTIRAFQIGCAGPSEAWTFGLDALRAAGFSAEQCVDAGIASVSKRGTMYDAFRGRLVFPIYNTDGEVIAVAGRLLVDSDKAPKYVNSKETIMFKKKHVLFGAHLAREALLAQCPPAEPDKFGQDKEEMGQLDADDDAIDEDEDIEELSESFLVNHNFFGAHASRTTLVVVEGYMDVIALYEHSKGMLPVVATMGTAVSVEQVEAVLKLLPDQLECSVIFNFDADSAGVRAAERLCDSVLSQIPGAFRVAIAFPPKNVKDVDQFLNEGFGTVQDYLAHLKSTAVIWPKWRGQQIVQEEMDRIAEKSGRVGVNFASPEAIESSSDISLISSLARVDDQVIDNSNEPRLEVPGLPKQLDRHSEALFNYQVSDELSRQTDRMLLAFGAPKVELQRRYRRRRKTITLECSPDVIEKLAQFIARTKRCLVGLNASELMFSWADRLSGGVTEAVPGVFDMIAKRMEELNREWAPLSPAAQVRWMPPAPWILDELAPRERNRLLASAGLAPDGSTLSLSEYHASPGRRKLSLGRLDFQSRVVEPAAAKSRCKMSRRFISNPRAAAEERVLRALIFCGDEAHRLDALDALLRVMMRCEEKSLSFWTANERLRLFDVLAAVEGNVKPEEIAAACEGESWWTFELEDIFIDDFEGDAEWAQIMQFDRDNAVLAAEIAAKVIEAMETRIRGRLAVDKMDVAIRGAIEAGERGDFDSMDDLTAQQMMLKRAMRQSSVSSPEQHALIQQKVEEIKKEMEQEEQERRVEELLKSGEILPYPDHLRDAATAKS